MDAFLGQRVKPVPEMRVVAPPAHKDDMSLNAFGSWANAMLRGENLTVAQKYSRNMMLTRLAASFYGTLIALMSVMIVAKILRRSGIFASARERPLQALAEPLAAGEGLAPEAKTAMDTGDVQAAEYAELRAASQMYLSRVYV